MTGRSSTRYGRCRVALVDLDRHRKLIRERVIPPPRGVNVGWIDCGKGTGVLVIDVPPGSLAADFLHVDTVVLTRLYCAGCLSSTATRRMHIGGVTTHPTGEWTVQQARNLALDLGERFGDFHFLIHDRGSNFTRSFDAVFQAAGTTIVRTAVQAPRMNAICERLIGTLRRELLDRTLSQAHLCAVLVEYQEHYNSARPHQGIGQRVPGADPRPRVHRSPPRHLADPPKTPS